MAGIVSPEVRSCFDVGLGFGNLTVDEKPRAVLLAKLGNLFVVIFLAALCKYRDKPHRTFRVLGTSFLCGQDSQPFPLGFPRPAQGSLAVKTRPGFGRLR